MLKGGWAGGLLFAFFAKGGLERDHVKGLFFRGGLPRIPRVPLDKSEGVVKGHVS
jgi:hypothetical protein